MASGIDWTITRQAMSLSEVTSLWCYYCKSLLLIFSFHGLKPYLRNGDVK